jgi:acyl carrier protein
MEQASKAEILREIQRMMKELFELEADRVNPEARLIEDLELDSIDAIDIAAKVEETTGMPLDEKLIRELRTVEDVIVAVHAIAAKQGITSFRSSAPEQKD